MVHYNLPDIVLPVVTVVNACSDDCNMQEGELSHLLVSLWITII
jgi:hypothetical protein